MKDIWFISDTHFSHANFLKFKDDGGGIIRPFDCVHDMDGYMIEKWNSVVKPGDRVYHLGDVCFDYEKFDRIAKCLNGSKRLILGNHDELKNGILQKHFKKVTLWRIFKDEAFICSHIPLREDQMRHYCPINVHGHIHEKQVGSPFHFNVCVEHHDYTPVHIDVIKQKVEKARVVW